MQGTGTEPIVHRARGRVGRILRGKYRLDALLGIGGMAAVYAATHRNGKRVAIKILHPEMAALPDIRSRFLTEGYVANRVTHPGAVAVIDDEGGDDDNVFLVMELLEGETLAARVRRRGGRLPVAEVLAVADQLLDVLAAAHDASIVHRDLKPENVFITIDGMVKVLDFGIARINQGQGPHGRHNTQVGVAMGTPAFLAPEQARGRWEMVDAQTDQWAVGATLFHAIAGRDVHQAATTNELLLAAMTRPAVPLASVAYVHPMTAMIVDRALSYDKEARFPDTRAMQRAVRAAAHALGEPIPSLVTTDLPSLPVAPAAPFDAAGTDLSVVTTQMSVRRPVRLLRSIALGAALAIPVGAGLGFGIWWLAAGRFAPPGDVSTESAPSGDPAAASPAIASSGDAAETEVAADDAPQQEEDAGAEASASASAAPPASSAAEAADAGSAAARPAAAPRTYGRPRPQGRPGFLDKRY